MGRNRYTPQHDEGEYKTNGTRSEKKKAKRSSRHNTKIMIDKTCHGLVDSNDLEEYLDKDLQHDD